MILRVQYNDNDYKTKFEAFFKRFKFSNYYYNLKELDDKDDIENLTKYRDTRVDMEELYEKVFFKSDEMTDEEKVRFASYVKDSILAYIKQTTDSSTYEYFKENIQVTLSNTFSEVWENDEVIYYFISADKTIVQ